MVPPLCLAVAYGQVGAGAETAIWGTGDAVGVQLDTSSVTANNGERGKRPAVGLPAV